MIVYDEGCIDAKVMIQVVHSVRVIMRDASIFMTLYVAGGAANTKGC
jgi:hypothetical protein